MTDGAQTQAEQDERCLVDPLLKFLAQEWMSHVIFTLGRHGTLRFGALRRLMPTGVSARVLSARLKALEATGHVERHDRSTRVLHVEYSLTKNGQFIHRALSQSERLLPPATGTLEFSAASKNAD